MDEIENEGEGELQAPAKNPCGTCPYRKDVPSGIWHHDLYAKLTEYDGDTHAQAPRLFACHQQDGRLCAGWVGTHPTHDTLAMKIALVTEQISIETYQACVTYESPVPLFESGYDAARHGLRDYEMPDERARRAIAKLRSNRKLDIQ